MAAPEDAVARLIEDAERALDAMIDLQREKVGKKARELVPGCSWEEMMNPDGVPALRGDALFNYEDGLLAGLISARVGLRARAFNPALGRGPADGPLPALH